MSLDELREQLRVILDAEERTPVDWSHVNQLIDELQNKINADPGSDCPHLVYHFLSDSDIRAKDAEYGASQRADIRRFAETGDRSVVESAPAPKWPLFFILGLLIAASIWLIV
jgi:hypothetical protein